jgi:hypothetical protein
LTHNQIGCILIPRRQHTSILDVWSFRGADCGSGHSLMVANVRKRLAVSTEANTKIWYREIQSWEN